MNELGPLWDTTYDIEHLGQVLGHVYVTDNGRVQRWIVLSGEKLVPGFTLTPLAQGWDFETWSQKVAQVWAAYESPLYVLVESRAYQQGQQYGSIDLSGNTLPKTLPEPVYPFSEGGYNLMSPATSSAGGTGELSGSDVLARVAKVKPPIIQQLDVGFFMSSTSLQSGRVYANEEVADQSNGYQTSNIEYWLASPALQAPTSPLAMDIEVWEAAVALGSASLENFVTAVNQEALWVSGARLDVLGCRYYRGDAPPKTL